MDTPELEAFSIFLRISYNWFASWLNPAICDAVIWFWTTSILPTTPLPAITCSFLFNISNLSPTFKDDLSIGVFKTNVELPNVGISIWNLELVLYIQELANICL